MWPFKKKNPPSNDRKEPAVKSVICIPGNWRSWDEFILLLVEATNGEYIAAGNVLIKAKSEWHCTIEFCERDERMKKSFEVAGSVTGVTNSFLNEIENHTYVIYLSGPGGSLDHAEQLAYAAGAILKVGGIGVKVESAGRAFEKEQWLKYFETFRQPDLYRMYVIDSIISKDGTVHSCGMHNLGYKDTIVSGEEFQKAVSLITIFCIYQIVDKPLIKHLQTFQADIESPRFLIRSEVNQPNKGDELFENPFGMWRLTRM